MTGDAFAAVQTGGRREPAWLGYTVSSGTDCWGPHGSMPMIMRLRLVRQPLQLGMRVVMVRTLVGMGMPGRFILRRRLSGAVTVWMRVPVHMLMPVRVGVRVAVDQIPMPVHVVVHVLMGMGMLVVVVVRVPMISVWAVGR